MGSGRLRTRPDSSLRLVIHFDTLNRQGLLNSCPQGQEAEDVMSNQEYDRIMRAMLDNVDGSTISDDLKDGVANLASAAPDLLAACKAMLVVTDKGEKPRKLDEALTWRQNDELAYGMTKTAIAKAEVKP